MRHEITPENSRVNRAMNETLHKILDEEEEKRERAKVTVKTKIVRFVEGKTLDTFKINDLIREEESKGWTVANILCVPGINTAQSLIRDGGTITMSEIITTVVFTRKG